MIFITAKFPVRGEHADAWPKSTPRIVNVTVEGQDWSELGEMRVD